MNENQLTTPKSDSLVLGIADSPSQWSRLICLGLALAILAVYGRFGLL